ncbi:DoxX family protein [Nocardia stercoris]|uniref:DoxX family protein n=1 Tax=Nocardia stercoris TaxID=2483361 RepID=A0A3M2L5Y1_9NOCA|nr:DoxX family protein [Nocardia stercoris]RMI29958.1 DoxX family protein [Nocardia stercoris]
MTAITSTVATPAAARPGRTRNRVLWTLQILLGLFFVIASGLPKLLGEDTAVKVFHEIGFGDWFRYFTGIVEVSGGIGLMVPRLSGLAAYGLAIVMVCAAATQAFVLNAPGMSIFPLVLAVVFAWIGTQRGAGVRR